MNGLHHASTVYYILWYVIVRHSFLSTAIRSSLVVECAGCERFWWYLYKHYVDSADNRCRKTNLMLSSNSNWGHRPSIVECVRKRMGESNLVPCCLVLFRYCVIVCVYFTADLRTYRIVWKCHDFLTYYIWLMYIRWQIANTEGETKGWRLYESSILLSYCVVRAWVGLWYLQSIWDTPHRVSSYVFFLIQDDVRHCWC